MDRSAAEMTVGEIVDVLSSCDRDAPVRLAINPFFPMAHRLAGVHQADGEDGRPVVYLAESSEAEQLGPLPPAVSVALAWHEPGEAPPRRRRGVSRPEDGQ